MAATTKQPPSHFFDIIVQPLDHGIRFPALFMRRCGDCLKDAVSLKVPDGIQWKVELQVINGETWMKKGFHEFAEFYCVKKFHLLVFKYEGHSLFTVLIFDITATEIDYSFKFHPEFRPVKPQDRYVEPEIAKGEDVVADEDEEGRNSVYEVSDQSVYEVSDHESGRRRGNGNQNVGISYTFVNGRRLRERIVGKNSGNFLDESSEVKGRRQRKRIVGRNSGNFLDESSEVKGRRQRKSIVGRNSGRFLDKSSEVKGRRQEKRMVGRNSGGFLDESSEVKGRRQSKVIVGRNSVGFLGESSEGGGGKEKLRECESKFQSQNPFFACLLQSSSIFPSYQISIPSVFFQDNLDANLFKEGEKELKFNFRVYGEERMLPVIVHRRKKHGRIRGRGWRQIAEEKKVKVGEIWIFELVAEEKVFDLHKCG